MTATLNIIVDSEAILDKKVVKAKAWSFGDSKS